jgi:hypothetical protein
MTSQGATRMFCDAQQSTTLATMFFDHRASALVLSLLIAPYRHMIVVQEQLFLERRTNGA